MSNKLFRTLGVATVLSLAFSLTACGGNNAGNGGSTSEGSNTTAGNTDKKIQIKIYAQHFDEDTSKPFDYAVEELKKEMPEVEIVLDEAVQDGYQKLKTYAATGNMPDIYETDWPTLQTFAKSKNVELLDEYQATKDFKANLNTGNESRLIAPDGHVYAFPYTGIEFQMLFYNKDIFKEVGIEMPIKTIDQLAEAAKKLSSAGYTPLSIFAKEKWITTSFYSGLVTREETKGFGPLETKGTTTLPSPYVTAAEQMKKLEEAGLFDVNATNTNYDQASSLFYQGKAGMFVNGQWEIYSSAEKLGDKVDWMYWPAKDEATYENNKMYINGAGGPGGFAVSPSSKNVETAVKVASFIAQKYSEYKYTQLGSPIVATKVDKEMTGEVPAMMKRIAEEVLPNVKGYANAVSSVQIKNALDDNTQNMLIEGFSAKQFTDNMNRVLNKENK
ncbi:MULTISPECIES: extracellular solute-binding protein [Paenibacillus]|uniref:ABC transporter substrate-binding protein n=1 Tax=Paenibacillus TaxID=44249 RepID=UPI00096FABA3|nr:extracellular solute-binding protein [Paenibacillus odorifer]OMC99615.1 sugar ABC transporter substrate-binding protein [Paenibacillus odorifer]OMD02482.1 sugar ABC transporter substrate-binding protein [Paenibacillus odorifer]